MKNAIKILFCLSLGATLLTGCKETFANDSFGGIDFCFHINRGGTYQEEFTAPVNDVINLTRDEFDDRYMNGHLEDKYEYYTCEEILYHEDDEKFVFEYDAIRTKINSLYEGQSKPDQIVIQINYEPTKYTIQYVGFENQDGWPTTYTVRNGVTLPRPDTSDEYRQFVGWKIQGTDTIIKNTPKDDYHDLVLEPVYQNDVFRITYKTPIRITNPNPTTFTYYDDTINLVNIENHPDGYYTFDGFYLNDEKITSIDTHLGQHIEIECRFIFKEYTAKYYIDGELVKTATFTYQTMGSVTPPSIPTKDHYINGRWDEEVRECKDYEIHACYDASIYKITYTYPFEGVKNDNITTFTAFDGVVNLKALADSDKGYYTFDGFYLNNQKITTLDTSIGKDITLEAKYNFTEYRVNYYDDDGSTLLATDTFNYLTFNDYVQRDVPTKDHYYDGRWSEEITELKNYDIHAIYTGEQYKVNVVTGIDGYTVKEKTITYGQDVKYQDIADTLSYQDKYLIGLYGDSSFKTAINLDSLIDKSITIYAKWGNITHLSSASDWNQIVEYPSGHFVLDNDISFIMDAIPVVDNFTGILSGRGHKIQRFSNSNTSCEANYGLFKTNSGTIENLTVEDGSFVSSNVDGANKCYLGVLCGTNKGTIENVDFVSVTANITPNNNIAIDYFGDANVYSYVGICCGYNQGTISNCYIKEDNQLTIKAKMGYYRTTGASTKEYLMYDYSYYGLLAGANGGTISNITSSGSIIVNGITVSETKKNWSDNLMDGCSYRSRLGGIVGNNESKCLVTACESDAKITVNYATPATETSFSSTTRLGGIVGNNIGSVEKCHTSDKALLTNTISGDVEIGGVAGRQEDTGKIRACYSECQFSNNNGLGPIRIGGIIGYNCGSMSYCHATVANVAIGGTGNRGAGIGALVGYTNDTSSVTLSIGIINIENQITILNCYDLGYATGSAILNKVSIYAPTQANEVLEAGITQVGSEEELILATRSYYFDEVGFVIYSNKLPEIQNIGKQQ